MYGTENIQSIYIVALVLPLPDPGIPEQHEKCCILCKELPVWKTNIVHSLRCRLHHYYKPKADSMNLLLNRNQWESKLGTEWKLLKHTLYIFLPSFIFISYLDLYTRTFFLPFTLLVMLIRMMRTRRITKINFYLESDDFVSLFPCCIVICRDCKKNVNNERKTKKGFDIFIPFSILQFFFFSSLLFIIRLLFYVNFFFFKLKWE